MIDKFFKIEKKEIIWGGVPLSIETGKIARQTDASVLARLGETVVLATVVAEKKASKENDFFPLSVHYQEKGFAGGKIPSGFVKREGKPSDHETLISRLIDRPIRPLFENGYNSEVQVICTVLSYDGENNPDILSMVATSAALSISGIPFLGPIGASRVGLIDGKLILNPTKKMLNNSNLDLVVAGTETGVLMVESEAKEISREEMFNAVKFGFESFKPVIEMIKEFKSLVNKETIHVNIDNSFDVLVKNFIKNHHMDDLQIAFNNSEKLIRKEKISQEHDKIFDCINGKIKSVLYDKFMNICIEEFPNNKKNCSSESLVSEENSCENHEKNCDTKKMLINEINEITEKIIEDAKSKTKIINESYLLKKMLFGNLNKNDEMIERKLIVKIIDEIEEETLRNNILQHEKRLDGRKLNEVRKIFSEVGFLPRVHGSALFTRGETQALMACTFGTTDDEQIVDNLTNDHRENFMVHYNFPPYSVAETGRLGAPGRREIGHGRLAWRAINPLIPLKKNFGYTIRLVAEITESNGSSSMATVCAGSLAMMDAGIPIARPVAGIAMGLIKENDNVKILSDIRGEEDHLGDMDFKVAGTKNGITALQMDIKITEITFEIINNALIQAVEGVHHILGEMEKTIKEPRENFSKYAPQMVVIKINKDKIRDLIGPGGKTIREICEKANVKVEVGEDGNVTVVAGTTQDLENGVKMVESIITEPELDAIFDGKVMKITEFGAFVNFMGKLEGLLHISEIRNERVEDVSEVMNVGDIVKVKLIGIDKKTKKYSLSMKALLSEKKTKKLDGEYSESGFREQSSAKRSPEGYLRENGRSGERTFSRRPEGSGERRGGERRSGERGSGERTFSRRPEGNGERRGGERRSGERGSGERTFSRRPEGNGERRSGERSGGERTFSRRPEGNGERRGGERRSDERRSGERTFSRRPEGNGERRSGERSGGERRSGERTFSRRPEGNGERRSGERNGGEREKIKI